MQPHMIVKGFDVLEHTQAGRFQIGELFMVGPLVFERPEEPLSDRGRSSRRCDSAQVETSSTSHITAIGNESPC
jgi:hypothetical protein